MESCKLPDVPLFRGLTETETAVAIEALRMRRRPFAKGEVLLEAGCTAPPLGVVLAGRVHMEHLDVWGSKTLLGQAGPGDLFAETYACLPEEPLLVSVVAAESGEVLLLDTDQLLRCGCEPWRWKMAQNLLRKTWGWPNAACTRLPRRYAGASRRIFRCWRGAAAVCSSTCPLTVSSWPTTWALTAAL